MKSRVAANKKMEPWKNLRLFLFAYFTIPIMRYKVYF